MGNPHFEPINRTTLDVKEVSQYLGVSVDFLYKTVRENSVPHIRIGKKILFKKDAIDQWLDQKMQGGVEDDQP